MLTHESDWYFTIRNVGLERKKNYMSRTKLTGSRTYEGHNNATTLTLLSFSESSYPALRSRDACLNSQSHSACTENSLLSWGRRLCPAMITSKHPRPDPAMSIDRSFIQFSGSFLDLIQSN